MRHSRQMVAIALAGLLAGCSGMEKRRWDGCAVAGGIIGGTLAGVGAGVGVSNGVDDPSDGQMAGAIGGGALTGAVLGALLGHALCDPVETPPPPPPVAAPPPPPAPRKIETLHGPNFDFDRATLKPGGKEKLDRVVVILEQTPALRVSVEGYTDSVGSDAYNQRLSERRADTAGRYLVEKGISASRITTKGFGESNPVASNDTAEGRAENRRVEILAR